MSIIQELKRRNVFRVAAAYLTGAWLLIEVIQTLFPVYGISDAAIRLVVTLLAIGFPLVLIFSWVYELTPEGLRLERDIDRSVRLTRQTDKKLDRVIIILLVLALGYFAVDKFVFEPERVLEIAKTAAQSGAEQALDKQKQMALSAKSIAVLPFINMSPDPGDEYFSDGLTEELIGALAKVRDLHVTARTSAFAFKGSKQDIRDIGKRLNVKTVLEGSVRREQNRVRITAQLINVADGYHLWAESYDYELKSVLALQETISRAIVSALQLQLSPQTNEQLKAKESINPAAYDLYLKGRYYWARFDEGGFRQSIEAFQKAITIDPDFAAPHAGLATVYSFSGYFGIMPPRQAFPLSIKEADTALALDPESPEALIARGMALLIYEWDFDRARDYLELALELDPNFSMAHWAYAEYLAVADPPAALESALRALSLDPLSLPIMNLVAFNYFTQGMYQQAIQVDEEMLAMNPNFVTAHWNLGIIKMSQGRFNEAIAELSLAVELSGGMPPMLAMLARAYAASGNEVQALATLAELENLRQSPDRGYASPLLIAYVYAGLGKTQEALNWLELAVTERDGWLVSLNTFPRFESLRAEPRFKAVLRRVDLPESDRS